MNTRTLTITALAASLFTASSAGTAQASCGGTPVSPGQNISSIVKAGSTGQTFCLAPGTYRLTTPISPRDGQKIVGQAGVVITGGKVVSNWSASGSQWVSTGFTAPLTINQNASGSAPLYPQATALENLYMDGKMLWKAGIKSGGNVRGDAPSSVGPGEYFVDYDADRLILGSNPSGHRLETNLAVGDLIASGADNVVVRDVAVEMAHGRGVRALGNNWQILNVEARMNAVAGIVASNGADVIGGHVHHNGQYGITGQGANTVVDGLEVSYNNAARLERDNQCYAAGGSKFVNTRGLIIRNSNFHDNYCNGIWLDINNNASLIEHNRSVNNLGHGMSHEISYNAIIRGNVFRGNKKYGLIVRNSPDDTISGNVFYGNGAGPVILLNGDRPEHPSALGAHVTKNVKVFNNEITLSGRDTERIGGQVVQGAANVFTPSGTNRYYQNRYHMPTLGVRNFVWNGTRGDKAVWNSLNQDRDGNFALGAGPTTIAGIETPPADSGTGTVPEPTPGTDTEAPTAPSALAVTAQTTTSVSVGWTAATDAVGVTGYAVSVNGSSASFVTGTSTTLGGLACGTANVVTVRAKDAAGNVSDAATLTANTGACAQAGSLLGDVGVTYGRSATKGRYADIAYSLSEAASIKIVIRNAAGTVVRTRLDGRHGAGSHHSKWYFRNDRRVAVPAGTYTATVVATTVSGARASATVKLVKS